MKPKLLEKQRALIGPSTHNEGDRPHQRSEMAFVKAHKTKAYFKHFPVKFKRRAGTTDCRAETHLTNQEKYPTITIQYSPNS